MNLARIILASSMLLAIVFKSLPDSVFDHFHNHEHSSTDSNDYPSVGNYKHNCQIEDWNFESFEITENQFQSQLTTSISPFIFAHFEVDKANLVRGIGRAPPVA